MPDIPDLSQMSPDRWLSKMQEVREELLAEFVRVLSAHDEPASAAEAFRGVFDDYALPDDEESSAPMLAVLAEESVLVFERESTGDERALRREEGGRWALAGDDGAPIEADSEEEAHRELATRVLELLTWWSDGAFADKVGRPEAFVEPEED